MGSEEDESFRPTVSKTTKVKISITPLVQAKNVVEYFGTRGGSFFIEMSVSVCAVRLDTGKQLRLVWGAIR